MFEAIVRSNGWDDVTAALQLLSHLDGDALNVALLVSESRRVVPGFLIKSLSDHYNAPGQLAEYKRQFQRAFRRPWDDPSTFAIELETLARRAFMDIDTSIQLQMVRYRFINGQAECALRRHLDSLGPDTPMADIVDCCRVWERHREVEIEPRTSVDRRPARAICQVTADEPAPAASPETGTLEDIIRTSQITDVLYAEEHDSTVQQVSLRDDWLTQTANDSCGEGCAQLDDFNWFLPADERAGDIPAPEMEEPESESEVEYIEPYSTPLQMKMTAKQLLCPPVVAQTRPMEGCSPASPRWLRRGRDVLTEDDAVAVDTRQVSAAWDTVVSREIHRKSECIPTVVPKLAAAPQVASEVVQPRPRDSGCMDLLPPVGECLESLGMEIDTPDAVVSGTEVAGGSPLADIDISGGPDVLPTAISATTVVSEKWMDIDTPDAVVSGMEVDGGSPPADIDISGGTDVPQTAVSVTTVVSEEWMERFVINLDVLCSDGLASGDDPAGGSSDVSSDVCVVPDPIPTVVSVRTVVAEKWMDRFVLDLVECPSVSKTSAVARTFGPAVSEEYSPLFLLGGGGGGGRLPMHTCWL